MMTTTAEFSALLVEYSTAKDAYNSIEAEEGTAEDLAAAERYGRAFHAMLEARPTELLCMCRQLYWLATDARGGDTEPALRHLAEQLTGSAPS